MSSGWCQYRGLGGVSMSSGWCQCRVLGGVSVEFWVVWKGVKGRV